MWIHESTRGSIKQAIGQSLECSGSANFLDHRRRDNNNLFACLQGAQVATGRLRRGQRIPYDCPKGENGRPQMGVPAIEKRANALPQSASWDVDRGSWIHGRASSYALLPCEVCVRGCGPPAEPPDKHPRCLGCRNVHRADAVQQKG